MCFEYDILVIGGGMSGVSAAVSAAKRGLRVMLVEQLSLLGGMGTAGLITMVMTSRQWFYGFGKDLMETLCARASAWREDT
jgi:glycine/D-amino acid oxidase-like deaminating enzyme